jgi:transposase-like protein
MNNPYECSYTFNDELNENELVNLIQDKYTASLTAFLTIENERHINSLKTIFNISISSSFQTD